MNGEVRNVETVDMMIENMMLEVIRNQSDGESRSRRFSCYEKRIKREIVCYVNHAAKLKEDE